ncbi:hypothetical protein GN244_ATG02849 [Phytophthora infestans]|uniref:Uncharacterized protein n=1 Tax=Phytophthora infestans TaxID=4787 RepID=A0A833WP63_PHYIN|nr:hypothetical protein GN244_ATG02849 [Phytophthora infestans]
MVSRVDSPPAPVLECGYEPIADSKQRWKVASMIYHGVLIGVIVVAILTLGMVQAGIVDVGDSDDKDDWVEVCSQIINAAFTWLAVTNQPFYIYRFVMTTIVLKASGGDQNVGMESDIRAVGYLSRVFPHVFVSKRAIACEINAELDEIQTLSDESNIREVVDFVFFRNDVKYLQNTFSILNCGCVFQYVMSGYMWGYDESSRPGFALPVLLRQRFSAISLASIGSTNSKRSAKVDNSDLLRLPMSCQVLN